MEQTRQLVSAIINGIQEKKGQRITVVDLKAIDGAVADAFVICQGGSPTQVEAIAESIGLTVRKATGELPVHVVGLDNDQWVAMDYTDVLVHVFQPETRAFYDLENLWRDAKITEIADLDAALA